MISFQASFDNLKSIQECSLNFEPNLILLFISPLFEGKKEAINQLKNKYSDCVITGCSTAGEISGVEVKDGSIAFTAVKFENTKLKIREEEISESKDSFTCGKNLINSLESSDLKHLLIFSDGVNINGSDLVNGIRSNLKEGIGVTGGLAGDGADFKHTFIIVNGKMKENVVAGVGMYGDALKVGYGSKGGWDSFGIEREVTKSEKNILFELDGQPALKLYKSFLGDKAKELPSSGLLFPLSMRSDESETPVVRTILGISEEDQSLTFAGNIPQGSYVRLMKANIDRLINGAQESAEITKENSAKEPDLAILISCVGRRLVLNQLVEEEVEAVQEELGHNTKLTGFYSYGEIAPFGQFSPCQLHNQTMTITTFSE